MLSEDEKYREFVTSRINDRAPKRPKDIDNAVSDTNLGVADKMLLTSLSKDVTYEDDNVAKGYLIGRTKLKAKDYNSSYVSTNEGKNLKDLGPDHPMDLNFLFNLGNKKSVVKMKI